MYFHPGKSYSIDIVIHIYLLLELLCEINLISPRRSRWNKTMATKLSYKEGGENFASQINSWPHCSLWPTLVACSLYPHGKVIRRHLNQHFFFIPHRSICQQQQKQKQKNLLGLSAPFDKLSQVSRRL